MVEGRRDGVEGEAGIGGKIFPHVGLDKKWAVEDRKDCLKWEQRAFDLAARAKVRSPVLRRD